MVGVIAHDMFCFTKDDPNTCFQNYLFEFVAAYKTSGGFGNFQGLIGLAPRAFKGPNYMTTFLQ